MGLVVIVQPCCSVLPCECMTLPITIRERRVRRMPRRATRTGATQRYTIEVDRKRLDVLLAALGFVTKREMDDIRAADDDVRHGRVRRYRTPRDLRV